MWYTVLCPFDRKKSTAAVAQPYESESMVGQWFAGSSQISTTGRLSDGLNWLKSVKSRSIITIAPSRGRPSTSFNAPASD